MGVAANVVKARVDSLREFNPMLGRRGCRIGVVSPEIYDMQIRALLQAAADFEDLTGNAADLEIMVPFVASDHEMRLMAQRVASMAASLAHGSGMRPSYRIGAMLETPRSCLRADIVCAHAEFISFGTNDLTQMTYGLSRDDAGRFIRDYIARGALSFDPFHRLDQDGVGALVALGAERGRSVRPDLVTGLCGEHGGDPATIRFCEDLGLDYISCSPYRAPAARLAAAQATILREREGDAAV
jgi:pyruvate,orthophosphate dikinase